MKKTVTWTIIPNRVKRIENKKIAKLSIFISPRFEVDENKISLASSPELHDWLDWPATVGNMKFLVEIGESSNENSIRTQAEMLPDPEKQESRPDSELWKGLFKSSTFIRTYKFSNYATFNLDNAPTRFKIKSFSVKENHDFIRERYRIIAKDSPTNFPKINQLTSPRLFGQIASVRRIQTNNFPALEAEETISTNINKLLKQKRVLSSTDISSSYGARGHFVQLKNFHQHIHSLKRKPLLKPEELNDLFDFHKVLSALGEYPEIMRRLGLILDLIVPADAIPRSNVERPLWIRISSQQLKRRVDQCMKTLYIFDGGVTFMAASSHNTEPNITNGMLHLDDTNKYQVVQFDVDGANIKTAAFVNKIVSDAAETVIPKQRRRFVLTRSSNLHDDDIKNLVTHLDNVSSETSLPPLKSGFISVAKVNRAEDLCKKFTILQQKNHIFNKNLNIVDGQQTEDIILDAQDLMRGYRIDIKDNLSGKWNSLCKRKGTYSIEDESNNLNEILKDYNDEGWIQTAITQTESDDEEDKDSIDLNIHESLFKWQGWSLCVPRPGKTINPDDKIDQQPENKPLTQIKLKTSFRPEPNSLPRLRFGREYRVRARVVDLCGNGLDVNNTDDSFATQPFKYLRFDPISSPVIVLCKELNLQQQLGESLEHIVIRSFNKTIDDDGIKIKEPADRHICPPNVSQLMAEMHGMFDSQGGYVKADESTYDLIKQKDGESFEIFPPVNILDRSSISKESHYPIYRKDQAVIPYLSDPIAAGVSICDLPGTLHDSTGTIMLGEVNNEGKLSYRRIPLVQLVNIKIPQSVTKISFGNKENWPDLKPFRIRIVEPENNDLNPMPQWDPNLRVLIVKLAKADVAKIRISCYPYNENIENMGILEWLSKEPDPELKNKLKTLVSLGIHWMFTPYKELTLIHAVQQPIGKPKFIEIRSQDREIGKSTTQIDAQVNIHKKSSVKLDIIASWDEPVDIPGKNKNPDSDRNYHNSHVFDQIIKTDKDNFNIFKIEGNHHFPDTKYRFVKYQVVSSSRFREYFSSEEQNGEIEITRISDKSDMTAGVRILNSRRPDAPKVLYAIPTFRWEKSPDRKISKRYGGGLRIYMERPWYLSGDGELLGVVLWEDRIHEDFIESINKYTTQWGMDPIRKSHGIYSRAPKAENFIRRNRDGSIANDVIKEGREHLSLEEIKGSISVIGHKVHFDKSRDLWYCDIEIDPEEFYYPFVRLALVRYQPNSVPNAYLSRVVLTDFVQLTPNRTVTVRSNISNPNEVKVSVSGYTYESSKLLTYYNQTKDFSWDIMSDSGRIEVSLEKFDPTIQGLLSWTPIANSNIILTKQQNGPSDSVRPTEWDGNLMLPRRLPNSKFRLVIKEYEEFVTDSDQFKFFSDSTIKKIGTEDSPFSQVSRLVYFDIIDLE